MSIRVFDIFKVGIGPSSSHTVGPMVAARKFVNELQTRQLLRRVSRINVQLYGSLGLTGRGHGTNKAVLLGLMGETPEGVAVDLIAKNLETIHAQQSLDLLGQHTISFIDSRDLHFHRKKSLKEHPNGLQFQAFGHDPTPTLLDKTYFSIGGGFVIDPDADSLQSVFESETGLVPYPFTTAQELLTHCATSGLSISALALENEKAFAPEDKIRGDLLQIWRVMQECIDRGCRQEGILPGGLRVRRRAPRLWQQLQQGAQTQTTTMSDLDWVNLWALAVNEENAAGGRVVTAPTNGAAGIIPAVLAYALKILPHNSENTIVRFLLTAGSIAMLYKINASISGAEVGCQGEVGVACSMAAGALTEVLGGTPQQVENAAEIGMEHNLGLTCDPIAGLVQIPCIERNAMGAVKAINAARLALRGDGAHHVSLDKVILTMKTTGADMKSQYKETSKGGLAVNVTEC